MTDVRKTVAQGLYERQRTADGQPFDWSKLPPSGYDQEWGWGRDHWFRLAGWSVDAVTDTLAVEARMHYEFYRRTENRAREDHWFAVTQWLLSQ